MVYEYYNNTLTARAGELMDVKIFSKSYYDKMKRENRINVVRRACRGCSALIEWSSIPTRFKVVIEEKFGKPKLSEREYLFINYLRQDQKAIEFYKEYVLDNGSSLPQKSIREYVANASVLNAVHTVVEENIGLNGETQNLWENLPAAIDALPTLTYPHSLPRNVRRLKDKLRTYKNGGYQSLVSKKFGNKNSEKINEKAQLWVISRWADRVRKVANMAQMLAEYNEEAKTAGWQTLKSEESLHLFLNKEDVKHLWWGNRYGELKAKEKFMYQFSTTLPTMRDSLWYSDGTKMNYYYLNDKGNIATCQVYEVMDAFSEVLLGYHISDTEDYQAQYGAYKMAVQTAGHKPYQIGFDGQGGHKKLKSGDFLSNLSRLSVKTQPYNGKSKTIENAFKRLQTQFLKRDWFFTGQNITAKSIESKENEEFILANKGNLPTLAEVKAIYAQRRAEWNNALHPKTGQHRNQMYRESTNPETPEVSLWDMVDLFWMLREQPVKVSAYGITFKEKTNKYTYMVCGDDQLPDTTWLKKNIDKKVWIKFDPQDMTMIYLYEKDSLGLRFLTQATTKVVVNRGKQEQEEFETQFISKVINKVKEERISSRDEITAIQKAHGMTPEDYGLISPAIKGVESSSAQKKKLNKAKAKVKAESIGSVQKAVSNKVRIEEEESTKTNLYDRI